MCACVHVYIHLSIKSQAWEIWQELWLLARGKRILQEKSTELASTACLAAVAACAKRAHGQVNTMQTAMATDWLSFQMPSSSSCYLLSCFKRSEYQSGQRTITLARLIAEQNLTESITDRGQRGRLDQDHTQIKWLMIPSAEEVGRVGRRWGGGQGARETQYEPAGC